MKYLLLLSLLLLSRCDFGLNNKDGMDVTFPVTYIEWEPEFPRDTTWWTFTSDNKVYAAFKRKISEVSGVPAWYPHCLGYDANGNCVPRINSNGDTIGADGRTRAEYNAFWAAQIAGFLPIEYYTGTWGSADGMRLTIGVNRVVPGSYGGIACDLSNSTPVASFWDPVYIDYEFWRTDTLYGTQVYDDGNPIKNPKSGNPYVNFSKWNGKSLTNKSNSLFKQF